MGFIETHGHVIYSKGISRRHVCDELCEMPGCSKYTGDLNSIYYWMNRVVLFTNGAAIAPSKAPRLQLDHCHKPEHGYVRGWLCPRCNRAIRDIENGRQVDYSRQWSQWQYATRIHLANPIGFATWTLKCPECRMEGGTS